MLGLSSRDTQATVVAPEDIESSRGRNETQVPRIGRRSLTYCTTREVSAIPLFVGVDTISHDV